MKGKFKPELYLAFFTGIMPKELIAKGINKSTVYNYYRRYRRFVKPAYDKLLRS